VIDEPIDAVYTWVDGTWPGYADRLRAHARDRHDLNPNRYRDNLELLKYSLRSLERHVPWIRHVYVVTCRPQQPSWLDTRAARLVHHDAFMPAADLPTFNSFAIVSHLHRIDGLSRRFLYIEDDALFGASVSRANLFDETDRPRVLLKGRSAITPARESDARISPWNRALAYSNRLLNERYGPAVRRTVGHAPLVVDADNWRAMMAVWPEALARTSASRFRATGNVAPEHLYAHFMLEEGRAARVSSMTALRGAAYHAVNNVLWLQWLGLRRLAWQRPLFLCLNDDFGERPNPRVVRLVRRTLDEWFPERSRFEIE
jgi:hypothetical protein